MIRTWVGVYKKLRSSTVEPVLGTLINFGGMGRIQTRGIKNANKYMIGAAIAYNLKKWQNYVPKTRKAALKAMEREVTAFSKILSSSLFYLRYTKRKFSLSIF
ncbi:MAG: transposase [Cyclobacteriaceae bacterium]|nr:transposase [Cyclobacteriaceae bacterium]